ncbi:G protein-coupled glucose receptor regulating Gpa2-domain-containing protein [Truncatella angustata]|uniref:G protein-coupled glucose receptor regulating Gpa2-domain-containing protein n=1 Tax=Truncatella angustata TaxID=152316 RepID=A0A9P9A2G5_9PEZI|nr:G protein-coupled glucose receptor regulating Gpa2-domain-containing protein [Truncatella angustata]KAH6659103.1 G protein-coupled glucose receptor regulating Gpa2-domain-containing protein [Truncatella angustata]
MIAVHSALYILRSQRAGGETGLQPYRWYAYALWLVVPLILAAIVPITGARFEDNGPFCYLPQQNNWYRVYLSWVPRYIIFGVIFLVYTFLYIYIAWRFRRLRRDQRRASFESSTAPKLSWRKRPVPSRATPPIPPLAYHGLLDTSSFQTPEVEQRSRQHSVTSEVSTLKLPDYMPTPVAPQQVKPRSDRAFAWNWEDAEYESSSGSPELQYETGSTMLSPTIEDVSAGLPRINTPAPVLQHPSQSDVAPVNMPHSNGLSSRQSTSRHSWQRPLSSGRITVEHSEPAIFDKLYKRPTEPTDDAPSSSSPSLYLPMSITEDTLRKSRQKMNRQLRLLFVYPAIYILAWIAPFISQIYRYEAVPWNSVAPQPFGLFMVSVASLCIGAAVDCCFYSAWEKPWRHSKCGFWQGLAMRLKIRRRPHRGVGGRSREEERREATAAIDRRNVEQAERQAAAALQSTSTTKAPRQWWDIDDEYEL